MTMQQTDRDATLFQATRPMRIVRRFAGSDGTISLAILVVLLVSWQAAVSLLEVPAFILPAPTEVLAGQPEPKASLMQKLVEDKMNKTSLNTV